MAASELAEPPALKPEAPVVLADSDSGHALTSGSSSLTSSNGSSGDNVADQDGEDEQQFVDATDSLESAAAAPTSSLGDKQLEQTGASGGTCCAAAKLAGTNDTKSPTQMGDKRRTELTENNNNNNHQQQQQQQQHNGHAKADGLFATDADLKTRLEETKVILKMALNNEFGKSLEICARRMDKDLYASLAHATLSFLKAALTSEREHIQSALSSIESAHELSAKLRHKTSAASMVMRFLYRPNYNTYTDEEIHAELVQAESLLLWALISFMADQSIICFVRGALKIRTCYQRYKECIYIMEHRQTWASEEARKHFESGVGMGFGAFNIIMSYLPHRVLRFLEYVGFAGDRSLGIEQLEGSIDRQDGLRSIFSTLILLTYQCYTETLFGLGGYDFQQVERLNNLYLADYPNSAFFLLFRGRYYQMLGDWPAAIDCYQRCIDAQDDWKQFHGICYWEMTWCYTVQMDWKKAAETADLLRVSSKWSVASYTYQYGTFLYAQLVEDERSGLCSVDSQEYKKRMGQIREIMEQVPSLRIRYAGKTQPGEKFAITRSIKFIQRNNRLTLPTLEFIYVWNLFVTLQNSPHQVERLLARIDSEIEYIRRDELAHLAQEASSAAQPQLADKEQADEEAEEEAEEEEDADEKEDQLDQEAQETLDREEEDPNLESYDNWDDDLNLMLLLKAMCLKHLKRTKEAEEMFKQIVDNEPKIKQDTFLVPHSAMELAILKVDERQFNEAKQWIKIARNNYTGYLLETMVHFRLHSASRRIRLEEESGGEQSAQQQLAGGQSESGAGSSADLHSISSETQQVSSNLVALGASH